MPQLRIPEIAPGILKLTGEEIFLHYRNFYFSKCSYLNYFLPKIVSKHNMILDEGDVNPS